MTIARKVTAPVKVGLYPLCQYKAGNYDAC